MQIRIWGARGSIPTPFSPKLLRDKLRLLLEEASPDDLADAESIEGFLDRSTHARSYGGNTSCVEVAFDEDVLILDAGSGIRALGAQLFADGRAKTHGLHLFFTHFHWDHLCGLPFFGPLYVPDRRLDIWSWRDDCERLLAVQMADAHFPVKWPTLKSKRVFHCLDETQEHEVAGARVRLLQLQHPDGAFGYRIDRDGKSLCYLTDTEVSRNPEQHSSHYAEFVEGSDVVIVDAMYGFLEYHEHFDFGHSSVFTWVDFFAESKIRELVVFHHDPQADDQALDKLLESARRYRDLIAPSAQWELSLAHEGQRWEL